MPRRWSETQGAFGNTAAQDLCLPLVHVSGSAAAGLSTWKNISYASLGATTGTCTWTWGSGPTADAPVLNIGALPVPEPAAAALMLDGLLVAVAARWRDLRQPGA